MKRAVKLSLKFITERKCRVIKTLLESYRAAVNFYIQSIWITPGNLTSETLARLPRSKTRLSERYKSQALKQALEIIVFTKKSAKVLGIPATLPRFTGSAILDAKFVSIESGNGSFDLVLRLSTLRKGHKICLPTRRTAVLNKWLSRPGATLIQGMALSENTLTLWVSLPEESVKITGRNLGIDLGVNKLISLSDGSHLGRNFKSVRDKILRRRPGSKARQRAYQERKNFIGRIVNQLPWQDIAIIGVEDLHDMKRGKSPNRNKAFRKALAPWTYRQVLTRISNKAQENRVRLVAVDPRNTSRTCPICSVVSKDSRRGENFICVGCGYKADSDHVGAQNVLVRTLQLLGSVESPRQPRAM